MFKFLGFMIILAVLTTGLAPQALADTPEWSQVTRLTKGYGAAEDWNGTAVAMNANGNILVTGSPGWSHLLSTYPNEGALFVFTWPGHLWDEETSPETARLSYNQLQADALLGRNVAISQGGDYIVAGLPFMNTTKIDTGDVFLYIMPEFGWSGNIDEPDAYLVADDKNDYDYEGWSVDISLDGSTVVAGAPGRDDMVGPNQGAVYVFNRPPQGWDWWMGVHPSAILTSSLTASGEFLGAAVSVNENGSIIAAGAPNHSKTNPTVQNTGRVYIYERPLFGWKNTGDPSAVIDAPEPTLNDYFGRSVSLSGDGDTLAVGSINGIHGFYYQSGSSYVYEPGFLGWSTPVLKKHFTCEDLGSGECQPSADFGFSVALNYYGNRMVVGDPDYPFGGFLRGRIYIFRSFGDWVSDWTYTARTPIGAADYDRFGYSVDINSANYEILDQNAVVNDATKYWVLAGSPNADTGVDPVYKDRGVAYLYGQLHKLYLPTVRK